MPPSRGSAQSALLALLLLLAGFLPPLGAAAVVEGQIDNFESGTPAGWQAGVGHPAPPQNVATGGPAGVGDNYLRVTSFGNAGPGSRLAAFNTAQWAGDYVAAGVGAILMDVNNLGSTDLALRMLVTDGGGQFATNVALSTQAVHVPAGSGWMTVVFPIDTADLTAQTGSIPQALALAEELWIFHNPSAAFPPLASAAVLGVDNVEALPEPTLHAALCAGLVMLAGLERRRARRG